MHVCVSNTAGNAELVWAEAGMPDLTWIEFEVLHECFQAQALVAHIYKHITTAIEGTEGQGCVHQLLLYCDC